MTDQETMAIAFAYPGYLRIALRMLVASKGMAGLDEFEARAKAAIPMGDNIPHPLAKARDALIKDVSAVRADPEV